MDTEADSHHSDQLPLPKVRISSRQNKTILKTQEKVLRPIITNHTKLEHRQKKDKGLNVFHYMHKSFWVPIHNSSACINAHAKHDHCLKQITTTIMHSGHTCSGQSCTVDIHAVETLMVIKHI